MKINRRDFFKFLGITSAAVVLPGLPKLSEQMEEIQAIESVEDSPAEEVVGRPDDFFAWEEPEVEIVLGPNSIIRRFDIAPGHDIQPGDLVAFNGAFAEKTEDITDSLFVGYCVSSDNDNHSCDVVIYGYFTVKSQGIFACDDGTFEHGFLITEV